MSKKIFKFGLGLLAVAGLAWPSVAAVTGTKTLHGHVPAVVSKLASTTRLPGTNVLNLSIGLPVRDQAGLSALLQQVYDPSSPNYHQYLTPADFAARFGATEQDYQSVIGFARSNNLVVTGTHPNHLVLSVSGKSSDIEKAFNIQFYVYQHPTESRQFFAPVSDPVVDASLPILHVSGLDNYQLPHSHIIMPSQTPQTITPSTGSGPDGSYAGSDFRNAYVPGTTLTGKGQSLGLLQFDGFYPSDISSYASLIGLTSTPNIVVVPIDGGVAVPGGGNGEVCLDIEMTLSMAPGVTNIYVYEAPNPSPWDDLLSRMADDNLAKQLSCSWSGGAEDPTADQIFQQMALQGQTFFTAAGDTDAYNSENPIEFPVDNPYVSSVGGTVLTTGPNASFISEKVWNDRTPRPPAEQGSCGGISTYYTIPIWQQGINMATNKGSTVMRNLPDVAMTAENVWLIYNNGQSYASGGTSAASPLWASFTALVNQQSAGFGKQPVGFLNPSLYSLAQTNTYTTYFNDVTNGDNTWPDSPNLFFAVPGYDLCTGLGSPNGTNLINVLTGLATTNPPTISAPRSPWGTTLSVMNGGNPNGDWFLFVMDDTPVNFGGISNGWAVTLTSANPIGYASDNETYATPALTNLSLGNNWTVTLAVTNYGPSYSTNVLVSEILPTSVGGLSLLSSNATAGSVTVLGSILSWNLGNLVTNTGGSMTLVFHSTGTGIYTNSATVTSTTPDPNPDDDTAVAIANIGVTTPPLVSAFAFSHGQFSFMVSNATANASVIVQGTTNLTPPVTWLNLLTNTTPFIFTDVTSSNFPTRFYRMVDGP